jgi:hypothetical protein
MGRHLLDEHTADRLLSGVLAPEDAPPGYAAVAALLVAVRQPPTPQELAAASRTVVAMAEAIAMNAAGAETQSVQGRRRAGLSRLLRPRIAATLMAGALALFGGLASANALPDSLQHIAHVVFGTVGIDVPDTSSGPAATPALGTGGTGTTSASPLGSGTRLGSEASSGDHGGRPQGSGLRPGSHHGSSSGHGQLGVTGTPQPRHHARHLKPAGGTKGLPKNSKTTNENPSAPRSDKGLCNAWKRGHGKKKGRAFRRLRARADDRGETVGAYCAAAATFAASDELQGTTEGVHDAAGQGAGSTSTHESTVQSDGRSEVSMGVGDSTPHGRRGGGEHDGGTSGERTAREIRSALDSASPGDAP